MDDEALAKAKLEEIEALIKLLGERRENLLKALDELQLIQLRSFENRFEFNPPVPKDSRSFKNFLLPKILEAYRVMYGIDFHIYESDGLVSYIEFSKCSDEYRRKIVKAYEWIQRVVKEKA